MNHSLLSADRRTHLKVVVMALLGAILVVGIGIAAHLSTNGDVARLQGNPPVLKAGQPITFSGQDRSDIR
jgi:hypothetical protein